MQHLKTDPWAPLARLLHGDGRLAFYCTVPGYRCGSRGGRATAPQTPSAANECAESSDPVTADAARAGASPPSLDRFKKDGFITLEGLIRPHDVDSLNDRLEAVLSGKFDKAGGTPDKRPKLAQLSKGVYAQGDGKTLQAINVWKADHTFSSLARSPTLGWLVAQLGGWKHGARLAQDQTWCKPPGAGPLVFHRDSAYFDFTPQDVITVWLALDNMDPEVGPLEYAVGSHQWGEGRHGSASQFFSPNRRELMDDAAQRNGVKPEDVVIRAATVRAGGVGIHNGRTWHGSGSNESTRVRRGVGMHFVPAEARLRTDIEIGALWRRCQKRTGSLELPEEEMPTTYAPTLPL